MLLPDEKQTGSIQITKSVADSSTIVNESNEDSTPDDPEYTDPDESGLRSGKGPSFLSRLFGDF